MRTTVLCILLFLLGACTCSSPVDADDLAKEEAFILSSFPQLLPGIKAKDINAGGYQSAIISDKGELFYWGLVGTQGVETPTKVEFGEATISQVSLGGYHSLVVDDKGKLYSFGRGDNGVLGRGEELDSLDSPTIVESLQKRTVKLIAAGYSHSLALTDVGLFSWGSGARGQLGHGVTKDTNVPKLVKAQGVSAKHTVDICSGGHHTALLNDEGQVYTFGGNSYGALGLGHDHDVPTPTLVSELNNVFITKISCGGDHMLALSREGNVYAWGWGEKGQLGSGHTDNEFHPLKIEFGGKLDQDDRILSITAGAYATSYIVTEKGSVYAFGWGEYGILGNGQKEDSLHPTLIQGLSLITKVATGYKHALALTRNGDVYVFGEDTFGSLGLGDSFDIPVPPTESILPKDFGVIPPDPASIARNATVHALKTKGLNEASSKIIYHPTKGFIVEGSGRNEVTLANGWAIGVSVQEKRKDDLEDCAIVLDQYGSSLSNGYTRVLFGVYDGHNGKVASDFVSATFPKALFQELHNTNQTVEEAFINAYEYTNLILKELNVPTTGTTALTCMSMRNGTHHFLYTSNVGDSRAILSRAGKAIRLSYDHKATDEQEAERIRAAGGVVYNGRVSGILAISRALGDTAFAPYVISIPYTSKQDILPLDDDALILASDGLWDVVSDQEATDAIKTEVDAQKASKILLKMALERGSKDDITVIVARVVRPLFLG